MANRNTSVTVAARVASYLSGFDLMQRKTKETTDDARKRLAAQSQAMQALGGSALRLGAIVAAGVALAVARFAEFDQAISNVKAATQETVENMGLLREAALEAGASTVFTATEAANAIEELGKAGLTTAEILDGGLSGALTLAASSGLGVAEAAKITAVSLKQFNLEGDQASHVADLLAAGAGKAVGDVDDLSQALNQAGLIANGAGFSIEETTGVLSAFADAGLLGSDAGTSLKTAIIALQSPTEKAQKVLDKYGISVYDANGQMLSFEGIAGQLETRLGGLDDQTRNAALATVFGTDALRVANVLYTQGAAGIKKYTDQTNDSGYAAKVAADRLDNLSGDVEQLGGALDTGLIRSGSGANNVLRDLTQNATFLVNVVGNIPEPVLAVGLALTAAAAATLLTGGGVLTLTGKFVALKATLDASNVSLKTVALRSLAAGGAIGAATVILGLFVARQAEAAATTDEFKESLDQSTGALTAYTREIVAKKLQERGAFADAERFGITQQELTDAVLEGGDALDVVNGKLDAFSDGLSGTQARAAGVQAANSTTAITVRTLADELEAGKKAFDNITEANDDSTASAHALAGGFDDVGNSAAASSEQINQLAEDIRNFGKTSLDAEAAESSLQQSIDDATASFLENGASLDLGTDAGRANRDSLREIAEAAQESAAAIIENGGSAEEATAAMQRGRDALETLRVAYGLTTDEVQVYSDALNLTPEQLITEVELRGVELALQKLQSLYNQSVALQSVDHYEGSILVKGKADGGAIAGPGSGTSDTAGVFRLSNGEHVLTAADVQAMGGQSGVYAMRRQLHGYAMGGAVQYAPEQVRFGRAAEVHISVPVSVTAGAIAEQNQLAKLLTDSITDAIRTGQVSEGWMSRG